MAIVQKNITTFTVLNSITNDINDQKYDAQQAFSFIEFLNYAKSLTNSLLSFDQYTIYIKNRNEIVKNNNESYSADVKQQFLNLLSEIKIKYISAEEKRFISNLDVNNEENLEIIIPFFARKIKEICLYFSNKRKIYNKDLSFVSKKGNTQSVEEIIKDAIVSLIDSNDTTTSVKLSSVISDTIIEVERQYDVFNDYYDLSPNKSPEFYNATGHREKFFTSNTNETTPQYFFDTETAIRQIIKTKNITLSEIVGLAINIDSTDLQYLDRQDTIDFSEPTTTNLKYEYKTELSKKYLGTDFYFISTNSLGEILSGNLFKGTNKSRNLLNVYNPATLTVESDLNVSEREVGLFFKPTYQGVIKMDSEFIYEVDGKNILPNKVYIFPDPTKYGNITNTSKVSSDAPLKFILDDDSVFRNISTSFGNNLPKLNVSNQQFTSYNTLENKLYLPEYSGNFLGIDQFVDTGDIYSKETDIFGNIFVSFSNDGYFKQQVDSSFVGGLPTNLNFSNTTTTYTNEQLNEKETLSYKQLGTKKYFIIDIKTQNISPLSAGFDNVLIKYVGNIELYNELNNSVLDLALFGNVFFITTLKHVVIDSFTYDNELKYTGSVPVIINYNRQPSVGEDIKVVTNPYRVGDYIYYSVITTRLSLNTKYVIYSIYRYNVKTLTNSIVLDLTTDPESMFESMFTFNDMITNIIKIRQSKLTYNSKTNTFLIVTNFVDLNYTPLIHTLIFKIKNTEINIILNKYFKPTNDNITENFYADNILSTDFITQSINSTTIQTTYDGTISF